MQLSTLKLQVILPYSLRVYKKIGKRVKRIRTYIYPIDLNFNPVQNFLNDMSTIKFLEKQFYEKNKKYDIEIIFGSNKKEGIKLLSNILNLNIFNDIELIFHRRVNCQIDLSHIDKIHIIKFRGKYNKFLDKLPKNIAYLHLSKNHNQNSQLPKVVNLIVGFTQFNLYDSQIENIYCVKPFNKPVDGLNQFVKKLSIESPDFSHPLTNLPFGLKSLTLVSSVFNHELAFLPESLEYLELSIPSYNKNLSDLPNGIKKLTLNKIDFSNRTNIILPTELKVLTINIEYLHKIKHLPNIKNIQLNKIMN